MGVRKGPWSGEEDLLLRRYIEKYGEGNWHLVSQRAGLNRCRKSCRLRWVDYLNPDVNREEFKEDEVNLIIRMHKLLGNRWSLIAGRLPGRTACHIKNYWNSHLKNRVELSSDEFTFPLEPKRHQVFKPKPRYFASKQRSTELCISNIHQTRQQYDILPATGEEPDKWWNDFLLQADVNQDQNTCLIDAKGGLWDDIASMNNWLMED